MSRTPDEILGLVDQIQERLDRDPFGDGKGEFDVRSLVWDLINDVCSSYELALLPLVGGDMTGDVNNTVYDYLSNHYGDDA